MTRFWEDYTQAEQQAAINQRQAIRDLSTTTLWTVAEQNAVRRWLLNVGRMLIDLRTVTAEEHYNNMYNNTQDPIGTPMGDYQHRWHMGHTADYLEAFLYSQDADFRRTADADAGIYERVLRGFDKHKNHVFYDIWYYPNTMDLTEEHPPPSVPPLAPVLRQTAYRARNDDGTIFPRDAIHDNGATYKAAVNTAWSQAAGENFRVRFQYANDPAGGAWLGGLHLWYSVNAGEWRPVGPASPVLRPSASPHEPDNNIEGTHWLPAPVGYASHVFNTFDSADGYTSYRIAHPNGYREVEYCLRLVPGGVVAGDVIRLQMRRGTVVGADTPLDYYDQTPVVTVV